MNTARRLLSSTSLAAIVNGLLVCTTASRGWALNHSGTCTGTFAPADNPHVLTGNCRVPAGQTLTIQPGVTLNGQNDYLEVQAGGTLNAVGTSAAQRDVQFQNLYVYFDAHSGVTAAGTGQLTNCTVTGGEILITDGSPMITNCTLNVAGNVAIAVEGSSQAQITGNAITENSNYAALWVKDSAQPTITGNTLTTNGTGLYYQDNSAGTASGNTIGFLAGQGSLRFGLLVLNNAAPVIDGNTILDDPAESDTAIRLAENAGVAVHVTNNVVHGSGTDAAVDLTLNTFGPSSVIAGNQFPAGVAWTLSGTLSGAATLGALNGHTAYQLRGNLAVANGAVLTIQPGVTLNGQNDYLEVQAGGTLNAVGTSAAQRDVQFQNLYVYFDAHSGVTAAGTGQLTNCTVTGGEILITDGSPMITNCTLNVAGNVAIAVEGSSQAQITGNAITENSNYAALWVKDSAQPTITGNTLTTNGTGLYYQDNSAGTASGNTIGFLAGQGSLRFGLLVLNNAAPVIDGNTILDDPAESDTAIRLAENAGVAVHVTNNVVHGSGTDAAVDLTLNTFGPSSVIAGNQFPAGVAWTLSGTLSGAATLGALNGHTAYQLRGNLAVANGAVLTIQPGVTLNGQNDYLEVQAGGTLNAVGTSAAQRDVQFQNLYVYFDAHSGVTAAGTGQLTNCTVTGGEILITDGSPMITNCTLNVAGNVAIAVEGSSQAQITGNAITENSNYAALWVKDSAQPTITGNTLTTNGTGLYYQDNSAGTASGNTIGFLAGQGSLRFGLLVLNNAAPVIDGNTILDDPAESDTAIRLAENAGVAVHVTNNVVHGSGTDAAVDLTLNTFGPSSVIAGNQFPAGVAWTLSGTLSGAATLGALNGHTAYQLRGNLAVANGAVLTIQPGVTLNGQNDYLEVQAGGTLNAVGTSAAQRDVQFQNLYVYFDAHSGVTAAGTGQLTNCTLTGPNGYTLISIADGAPTVQNCTFSEGATAIKITGAAQPIVAGSTFALLSTGIDISGAAVTQVTSNTFQGLPTAIYVHGTTSRSTIADNTFDHNSQSLAFDTEAALFSAFPQMFDTNTFAGAEENFIALPSSLRISTGGTLDTMPVPYLAGGLTINQGATLFLKPGVVLANTSYSTIQVNGDLVADASQSPERPIIFSAQSPKSGTPWGGLVFSGQAAQSASVLDSCIIEFGGGNQAALQLNSSSISIKDTTVSASNSVGIAVTNAAKPQFTGGAVLSSGGNGVEISSGSQPNLTQLTIMGNGGSNGFGMKVDDCQTGRAVSSAQNIYWGDDSGPMDNSKDIDNGGLHNPMGRGNQVSDCINYDHWTRLGPSTEGSVTAVSGSGQSGPSGSVLPQPVVVQVTSRMGTPLGGINVIFSTASGDAQIETDQPVTTDANGKASATVRLGTSAGQSSIAVTARDVNSPLASFTVGGAADTAGVLFVLTSVSPAVDTAASGDVDGDGHVDIADAALMEGVFDGMIAADEAPATYFTGNGDANGDGVRDVGDERVVLRKVIRNGTSYLGQPELRTRALRAYVRPPRVAPGVGETFRMPVYIMGRGKDIAAYALQVHYDPSVLRIVAVDGGTRPGFVQRPLSNPVTFKTGQTAFAAVNRGLLKTGHTANVANIVFRVVGSAATAADVELSGADAASVVGRRSFEAMAIRGRSLAVSLRQ